LGASDPRESYLSLISIDKSHINLSPPIIFLFGGAIDPPTKSVRGALYNHILLNESVLSESLVIPEDFKDWLNDSVYPDLLSFESDLAETSSLVIIALESAGAIAELGSFSVNSTLNKKVIIIISRHHHEQESFITLGPLRLLQTRNIIAYPYDHKCLGDSLNDYLEDIVDNIKIYLDEIDKTESFNVDNNGHAALLVYELIVIFRALKLSEIQRYLKLLSIDKSLTVIKRFLFLLDKLSLVSKKRLGRIDYYVSLKTEQRVEFSSKNTSKLFDRNAALIGTAQYYAASDKEKMRRRVIEQSSVEAAES